MSGRVALEAFISKVERLREMDERVAKAAEKPVADVARASARAAETPSGEKWPERKEGGKALSGAADAIASDVKGNRVILKIGKPYVFHHHGAGGTSQTKEAIRARKRTVAKQEKTGTKSKFHAPRRQILPLPGEPMPEEMSAAIEKAAQDVFAKAMGGR